jgi:transcriptional regulator with PAS, ATPase and Fis domain
LRALQEREFERLGSTQTVRVNVRVVAATNQDLGQLVSKKLFRVDLFYRLTVIPISLPPLRERVQDIRPLTEFFVAKFATSLNKPIDLIPDEVVAVLKAHDWPGNIRELQNFIERAVLFSPGSVLRLPLDLKHAVKQSSESVFTHACRRRSGAYPGNIEANRLADRRAGRSGQSAWIATYYADLQDAKAGN